MNSRRDRMRTNVEGDRISSLQDDLIAKILSFIGLKQAVETSVLSSRWRFVWTKIPYLNFSSKDFSTLYKFYKFFTHVTSYCDDQVEMSVNFHGKFNQGLVEKILNHACSCNLQQLTFTFLHEKHITFPYSSFSSRSLKHLTLIGYARIDWIPTSIWKMWKLPTLTTLHLESITLRDGNMDKCVRLISNFTNLKNLTIRSCRIEGSNSLTIRHPRLSNLTLKDAGSENGVKVVAPKLKILTIESWDGNVRIFAPGLTSMLYKNRYFKLSLDMNSLPYLEKVDLSICNEYSPSWYQPSHAHRVVDLSICNEHQPSDAHRVVNLFQKFSHVKFLTLNFELIEFLSSAVEAITHQPSPFVNLRSLVIRPETHEYWRTNIPFTMNTEIKNYLLDSSPGATFTIVTREEIRAMANCESARKLMEELRMLLELENIRIELKEEDKRPQLWWMDTPLYNMKRVAQVSKYWKDMNEEIKQWEKKTSDITSLMQRIGDLLMYLPTSNKVELQTRLSALSTEADAVVSKILNCMKNNLDAKQSSLSGCFHQVFAATPSFS